MYLVDQFVQNLSKRQIGFVIVNILGFAKNAIQFVEVAEDMET